MTNPWDKWMDTVDLHRQIGELSQYLLEAEGKVAVLTYERDVATEGMEAPPESAPGQTR